MVFRHSKDLALRFYDIEDALKKYDKLVKEDILTKHNLINNEIHVVEEVNASWFVIRIYKSNGERRSIYCSDDKYQMLCVDVELAKKFCTRKEAENNLKTLMIEILSIHKDTEVISDMESEDSLDKLKEYCEKIFGLKFDICMYEYNIYRVIK